MTMIDKIAKAISGQDETGWNDLPENDRERLYGGGRWHDSGNTRDDWRECARAALAVLLEPSEVMIKAAEKAGWDDANCMPSINMHEVSLKAAIQAALDEK